MACEPMRHGEMSRLMRYAGPRAPQLSFRRCCSGPTSSFLRTMSGTQRSASTSAALRAGQVLGLFLTSCEPDVSPLSPISTTVGDTPA